MKHKLLFAAATAALLAPSLAAAQDGSGVYVKGQLGYGVITDVDVEPADDTVSQGLLGEIQGEGNLAYNLAIGYEFANNWRIELDGSQLRNDMGAIGNLPATTADLTLNALMLNAYYDFEDFGRWEPYIGAGIGFAEGDATLAASDFPNSTGTDFIRHPACVSLTTSPGFARSCSTDDNDKAFAWNILAGLGYNVTEKLTWDTSYRYMDVGDLDYSTFIDSVGAGGISVRQETGFTTIEGPASHTVMTGFRYRFGADTPPPPPPPPPPPEVECWDGSTATSLSLCPPELVTCWDGSEVASLDLCPAELVTCPDGVTRVSDLAACPVVVAEVCDTEFRQEIIYYEFDRAQSAETRNSINRILDIGQFCQIDGIRVVGHTDTSGSRAYNQGLSERRAADASEELVRQGMSEAMIVSEGKGETEPFVDTGDGVREQLNRRTEVLLTLSTADSMN